VIGLIALYSSYDQINLGSRRFSLNQQWGIWCSPEVQALYYDELLERWRRRRN